METSIHSGGQKPPAKMQLPPRTRLKMLILEADEETLDRVIAAIEIVCGKSSGIKQ